MTSMTRRSMVLGALAIPSLAQAQSTWPSGVITLVVPAPAGGSVDVIARLVQPALQQRLDTTVIVENRSGAATMLGAAAVAKAPRDGSKWLINADPQVLNPLFRTSMPFESNELDPVLLVGTSPNVLAAHPKTPYTSLQDVIEAARKPPGLNFAVISDTLAFVSMVHLSKLAGTQLTPVTYRGGAPAINDVLGGHVGLIAGSASLVAPFFEGQRLRPLVQTGARRHPALPNVPTVIESGFADFVASSFWGFYAPSGTAKPIVNRFSAELASIIRQDDITRRLRDGLMVDVNIAGPSEFNAFFAEQTRRWGQVIRENGLKSSN